MQMYDKNRAILHYGCGGLGNRLQVLGWCIDKAIEHQMKIYPMWNDTLAWREDFFDKFNISSDLIFDISKYDSSQVKTNLLNLPTELLTDCRQFQNYFTDPTILPTNTSILNHIFHVVEAECKSYFNSNSIEDGIYLMPAFCIKYKNNIFKHLFLAVTLILGLASCEDRDIVTIDNLAAPIVMDLSANSLVLDKTIRRKIHHDWRC